MKNIDKDGLLLSKIQGNIFLNSLKYTSTSSEIFIRRYMNSKVVESLDSKAFLDDSLTIEDVLKDIEEEYGASNYGSNKYSKETLYWIGYIYRYMAYKYNLSSKQVYKIIKPKELNERYYVYHTYDPSLAIDNILEEKNISFDPVELNKKLLSLLKTQRYEDNLIIELNENNEDGKRNFLFKVSYNDEGIGYVKVYKYDDRFYKLELKICDRFKTSKEFISVLLNKVIKELKKKKDIKELLAILPLNEEWLIDIYKDNNFKYLKENTKNVSLVSQI